MNEKDTKNIYRFTSVMASLANCDAVSPPPLGFHLMQVAVVTPSCESSDAVMRVLTLSSYKTSELSHIKFALIFCLQIHMTQSGYKFFLKF